MKTFAKHLLRRFGILDHRIRRRNDSFVMMFHGVGGEDMPKEKFTELIETLAKLFHLRPIDDLINLGRSQKEKGPSLFLTFDDGLRNNFTVAYPILKKMSIPATYYLCPGLIDNNRWIWTHEMRARLKLIDVQSLREMIQVDLPPSKEVETFIRFMKGLPLASRLEVENQIHKRTKGFTPSIAEHNEFDLMSWDEASQMDPEIITIGSHTSTHQLLDSASSDELIQEIVTSRSILEKRLNREVAHFCFPDGRHCPEAVEIARSHYRTSVTTKAGSLSPACDLHSLPRIGCDQDTAEALWRLVRSPVSQLTSPTTRNAAEVHDTARM